MKIQKNWYYLIDDKVGETIEVVDWVYCALFLGESSKSYKIFLGKDSRLDFFGFFTKKSSPKLEFNQLEQWSLLTVKQMFFNYKSDLFSEIISIINSDNSKSFIDIISIIKDKKLHIDSSIEVKKNIIWVEAVLKQKNIFIWNNWEVRGLPKLFVKSNSVKASHSCNIERISDETLFYLKSRWINENKAILMLIQSYFKKNFSCLKMIDKKIYDKTYNDFLTFQYI